MAAYYYDATLVKLDVLRRCSDAPDGFRAISGCNMRHCTSNAGVELQNMFCGHIVCIGIMIMCAIRVCYNVLIMWQHNSIASCHTKVASLSMEWYHNNVAPC